MRTTIALTACGALMLASASRADETAGAETRVQLGLTAAGGLSDFKNEIERSNPGLTVTRVWPVGLEFALYHDFGNGIASGGVLGPIIAASGDISFTIVPLQVDLRYHFVRNETLAAYVRAGAEKAFVSGDLVKDGSAGRVVGVGVEFAAPNHNGWGIEAAYHSTDVLVIGNGEQPDLKSHPYRATLSGFFAF